MNKTFIWHDGGRAAAGYVGHARDCAIRAVAIATGHSYSQVYSRIFEASGRTPREGVGLDLIDQYLTELGFRHTLIERPTRFTLLDTIHGNVVVRFAPIEDKRSGHVCAVVNGTIYDTWDASADGRFLVDQYWVAPRACGTEEFAVVPSARKISKRQQINSDAMAKVIERIKKMRNTAANVASTQGEIENAMRMASTMMLQYQLTDDDLAEDANESSGYGSMSVLVTGIRAASWEKQLAGYVCRLLGDVFWFFNAEGHRTKIVFYGRIDSVEAAVALFTELLLEIATLGRIKYGGYAKGSGASYCEGFVRGLREILLGQSSQSPALIESSRQISAKLETAAKVWLRDECGISLYISSGSGRSGYDENAAAAGQQDGRARVVGKPGQLRIAANS
jgi:hypothetical protein